MPGINFLAVVVAALAAFVASAVWYIVFGKELAKVDCPERDRFFFVGPVSPDGAVLDHFRLGPRI